MADDIEIDYAEGRIGSIKFDRGPGSLNATRTASGFEVRLPIEITMRVRLRDEPMAMLSNLRGNVLVKTPDGSPMSVGVLTGDFRHPAGISTTVHQDYKRDEYLRWTGTFADLAYIEKTRDGQPPQFQVSVEGEWSFLVRPPLPKIAEPIWNSMSQEDQKRFREYASFRFLTEPQRFYSRSGYVQLTYPREVWVDMLRRLGVAENVLVEVPFPPGPSDPWNSVWKALVDARNAFELGGSTGWQATVTSVRHALGKWRDIEEEDQGAGWKAPSIDERESRTKKQRLDALRWHLLQAAHLGPHSDADEWTRDDALLILATLSALLAERKP